MILETQNSIYKRRLSCTPWVIRLNAFCASLAAFTITNCKLDGEDEYLFALEKHYSPIDHEESVRPYVYKADGSGLIASWRGSALAWPLIDAKISPIDQKTLCVLHRGDTFIELDKENTETRVAAYHWNGFGFSGINDSIACNDCKEFF